MQVLHTAIFRKTHIIMTLMPLLIAFKANFMAGCHISFCHTERKFILYKIRMFYYQTRCQRCIYSRIYATRAFLLGSQENRR